MDEMRNWRGKRVRRGWKGRDWTTENLVVTPLMIVDATAE